MGNTADRGVKLWRIFRTSSKFQRCIPFTLSWEIARDKRGDVVCEHDDRDPGGATKYGIDQRDHPNVDVCALTQAQAERIYFQDEWTKMQCEDMPDKWALASFDSAVNIGCGRTAQHLQAVVGARADGVIGPVTLQFVRIASYNCLWDFLNKREQYYKSLPPRLKWAIPGLLNRVKALRTRLNTV